MNNKEFRKEAHKLVDWMADYFESVGQYPVKPDIQPGEIRKQLPHSPPVKNDSFEKIINDFNRIIMPGITHWESPGFMGYFPANKSYPSVLAEMLTATLGVQCMSWITSPAATELEERMMDWLKKMTGLPEPFTGVIQDTASTATLTAVIMAREQAVDYEINKKGFPADKTFTVYCSSETHSSIEKNVKIAGFGQKNLRKIPVDKNYALNSIELEKTIRKDLQQGNIPVCVVATLGTTGSTAIDPLREIADICSNYDIFLHVDAAYAGTALLLPEMRWMIDGIESVDSFVFNPHKWMFTNFDCSAFFVKNESHLIRSLQINPEYLKTGEDSKVKNYRDWGIQLGRRFRALKLWFVIREFGVEGLQSKIRNHLALAENLKKDIEADKNFELLAPVPLNTICFRYRPSKTNDSKVLNRMNRKLLQMINKTGKIFLTHTKLNGVFTLRLVLGNTNITEQHVRDSWKLIKEKVKEI